jgi:hypothetical protein
MKARLVLHKNDYGVPFGFTLDQVYRLVIVIQSLVYYQFHQIPFLLRTLLYARIKNFVESAGFLAKSFVVLLTSTFRPKAMSQSICNGS